MDAFFNSIKTGLLNLDPLTWCEENLTLDGKPFRLQGNGYKPFADIYRYIGIKALERNSKPVILVKGRQVGATTMAAALELYFMCSGLFGTSGRPPIRIMHCFPQLELAFAYTKTKLNSMISTAKPSATTNKGRVKSIIEAKLDKNLAANDSLHFKQFEGGNHIWVESTGLNADRIRGRTVDAMFIDECQDIRGAAIGNAVKILSKAQYGSLGNGIQLYFGTPKQSGTEYWKMWQKSSQQYYYLGCGKCHDFFPLYTPGSDEWERIWLHGFIVRCTKCGHEQNKLEAAERGKWVALNPDPDCTFVGYHINQLYNPEFTKEKILAEKPENSPVNSERLYQNEVLGEFFAGTSAPITAEEIEEKCADLGRKFAASIPHPKKKKVYAGFDWGLKDDPDQNVKGDGERKTTGQSYSCAVILVADGPQLLSIEFAHKLKKNDIQSKRDTVEELFRRYNIDLAVGDIGYANDLTYILQQEYGDKFLASRAMPGSVKNHTRFVDDIFPKEIQFERDYSIEEIYNMMRNGNIKFPFGDYEKISWLVSHCCAMEIKVTKDRSGDPRRHYVKAGNNDGFMALINAVLAWKFDITDKFNVHNPNLMKADPNKKDPPLALLAHLPTWQKRYC